MNKPHFTMNDKELEKDPLKRWKLLPEARHHRILFFVVVILVLAFTLRYLMGW